MNIPSAPIIDFHVHAFPLEAPAPLRKLASRVPWGPVRMIRRQARGLLSPYFSSVHEAQTWIRHLPDPARVALDTISGLPSMASLVLDSTSQDLIDSMDQNDVDIAVLIAHEPSIPNSFVIGNSREHAGRLIAAVNVPPGTDDPEKALRDFHAEGARVLKIHASADGEGPESARYLALIKTATDLGMPVILHTGCIHLPLIYKCAEASSAENFRPWFEEFRDTRFVLAHMNYHDPAAALDLCQDFENLFVDTSWQPSETIHEAVRRIGAERVLFGSDWPLVGNNIQIGLGRIRECERMGWISPEQGDLIRGGNAAKLLGLGASGKNHGAP